MLSRTFGRFRISRGKVITRSRKVTHQTSQINPGPNTLLQTRSRSAGMDGFQNQLGLDVKNDFHNLECSKEDMPDLSQKHWTVSSLLTKMQDFLKEQPPLLARHFMPVNLDDIDGHTTRQPVRIMQWNCLAQALSTGKDNFVRCPDSALDWSTRRFRMVEEILSVNPDILCMQEVDHYAFFSQILKNVGYTGYFFPKPDSPALYAKDSNGPDGCAMFYKEDTIEIVDQESIVLKNAYESDTNQVSIICRFRQKGQGPRSKFCIATTHLKAKLGWDQLRFEQGSYLLKYLQRKVGHAPLIVCGDFNADPCEPVYKTFASSDMNLLSAYAQFSESGKEEPPYTTWKIRGGKKGTEVEVCRSIDFMWYTGHTFKVRSLLSLPTGEAMGPGKLPSFTYPSDHLSLAADFYLQKE